MKAHTYEKAMLTVGIVVLVVCGAALVYATLHEHIQLPGEAGRVHPQAVRTTPPFDQPGVRMTAPGKYEAVIVAQAWAFLPQEIRVPAGAEVTFIATTADIIHGLHIERTRLNMMLIPGQISRNTYTFEEPGEHLLLCHEYCGVGHHLMYGRVIVEPPAAPTAAARSEP